MVKIKLGKDEFERILHGDDKLTYDLYLNIRTYLLSVKKKYIITEELIKDIAQETMLILLQNGKEGNIRFESSINTYAISIARHLIFKFLKNKEGQENIGDSFLLHLESNEEIEELIMKEVKWSIFYKEFRNLSDECRQIIRLVKNRIKYKVICEKMKYSSVGYVKLKVHRCKSNFICLIENNSTYKKYKGYDKEDFEILGWRNE